MIRTKKTQVRGEPTYMGVDHIVNVLWTKSSCGQTLCHVGQGGHRLSGLDMLLDRWSVTIDVPAQPQIKDDPCFEVRLGVVMDNQKRQRRYRLSGGL